MPALNPSHAPPTLQKLDGRTREARLLAQVRRDLIEHVGGKPSATQRVLIERAAVLSLHIARLDAKAAEGQGLSEHAAKEYLAWSNSLVRTLRQLGMKGAAGGPPSLSSYIAGRAA